MSAYVVSKKHIDLMVRAALHTYPAGQPGTTDRLSWWQVDEEGEFAGWRQLNVHAESMEGDGYREYYTPSQLGQILASENVRSVMYRYSEAGRVAYYGAEAANEMTDDTIETLPGPCDRYYMAPYIYTDEAWCRRVAGYDSAPWEFDA